MLQKMLEMKESKNEFSFGCPCMSELVVPTKSTLAVPETTVLITSNDSSVNVIQGFPESALLAAKVDCTDSVTLPSSELTQGHSRGKVVDCLYKAAGCTGATADYFLVFCESHLQKSVFILQASRERVPQGTKAQEEHHQSCQYRPIPCLMQHVCTQLVPFHNFLLHHMHHFIYPTFSCILNTSVILQRDDFDYNHRWQPRWINCYDKHFFVMISHKIPGKWYFWVWMLGTPEEANDFAYDIEISKKNARKFGTYPVLSLRTEEAYLETKDMCLSMTDYQIKRVSQIKNNMVGSFDIEVTIRKLTTSPVCRFFESMSIRELVK